MSGGEAAPAAVPPVAEAEARLMSLAALGLVLDAAFPEAPPIGEATVPAEEKVRFRAHPGLGFPDREVQALVGSETGPLVVFQSLLGLHGPSSPLPPYFTERVIDDDGSEGTLGRFLDFFNHRLVSLMLRGFRHRRHHLRYRHGGKDALSRRYLALVGVSDAAPAADVPPAPVILSVLGLLALAHRSGPALAAVVAAVTGLPARVEEFVPRDVSIAPEDRCLLGRSGSRLGGDMVIGSTLRDRLGAFRVVVGPVDQAVLERLLPGEPLRQRLDGVVAFAVSAPLARSLAVVLAAGATPAWQLGSGRLGWTTWANPDPGCENVVVL